LREAALENFGVFLTHKEAKKLRKKLITTVYPELGCYLYENVMKNLAKVRLSIPSKCLLLTRVI